MDTILELFQRALQCHQGGYLQQAEELYRHILQVKPDFSVAHFNLGNVLKDQGNLEEAAGSYRQALDFNPDYFEAHNNLGSIFQIQGKLEEAAASYLKAIGIKADYTLTHFNLGNVLKDQGKPEEAKARYQLAIRLKPDFVDAYINLGNILVEQDKLDEAEACFRQALCLQPDHAGAHNNLGNALKGQGKMAAALACYRQALRWRPNYVEALNSLGLVLAAQGDWDESSACYRRALRLQPDFADAHNNLGSALRAQGLLGEAVSCYREAIRLQPDHGGAHNNLGLTLREQGSLEEAVGCFREALRLNPDQDETHFNLGMAWLLLGNFAEGWPEYEWRRRLQRSGLRSFPQCLWDGASLVGKTILLHAEQGLGDTLQFIRYAPLVKQQGGTVLFECPVELVGIMQTCPGIDQILAPGSPLPPFDVQAPLLSLPAIMKTALTDVPASIPYLSADATLSERWRQELNNYQGFRIGIVWQGNPRLAQSECHLEDQRRSIPLSQFEPLARMPGVRLFSLQKGYGTEQLADWKARWGIIDLGLDFMNTAAVMMHLDLIISADTAPAHLAGALGRPVWTVLNFAGDWRWLQDREDSPWYPTMRLFRQQRAGDWDEVFQRIAAAVREFSPGSQNRVRG